MKNKGFTLVELLAVIVVLAIVMGLAVVGITSVLENTRKSAFFADAKSFTAGAHSLVSAAEANKLLGVSTTYSIPDCNATDTTGTKITISQIPVEQGGKKSPYGNDYKQTDSFVNVTTTVDNGKCTYTFKVYLTDGVYEFGTASSPIIENGENWTADKVILKSAG